MELSAMAKKVWNQVVAKAWTDPAFKKRQLTEPNAVLLEHGLEFAAKPKLHIVENTDDAVYLVLPSQRSEELSEADLERVAAGSEGISIACYKSSKPGRVTRQGF